MIYFGIPLRSKASSNNWKQVCILFNRTLWSVYNQTNPNFRIIIACHEEPELTRSYDNRVEFIQVDIPFPKDLNEQMCDKGYKGYKVHIIGKRINELGGGYTMIVDADDLISNRIVDFVLQNQKKNNFGWYINKGYIYYSDKQILKVAPKFPSGSNCIINYTPNLLPNSMSDAWRPSIAENPFIIIKGHAIDVKKTACSNINRPIQKLPFRGAIYVLGTGDNHSTQNGERSMLRYLFDVLTPSKRITKSIKDEFSIDWLKL